MMHLKLRAWLTSHSYFAGKTSIFIKYFGIVNAAIANSCMNQDIICCYSSKCMHAVRFGQYIDIIVYRDI